MDLDMLLRDEGTQLSVLSDATREYCALQATRTVLIGPADSSDTAASTEPPMLTRPITVSALMAYENSRVTTESRPSDSERELHRLMEPGVPWWQRTWIILALIFVSPALQAALRSGSTAQQSWLQGVDLIPAFETRFDAYICGTKQGQVAVTPLEAVVEEITLWDTLRA